MIEVQILQDPGCSSPSITYDPPSAFEEKIARCAHKKWLLRCQRDDSALHDWLEAEAEITLEIATAEQFTRAKEKLARLFAERKESKKRLVVEHRVNGILNVAETLCDATPKLVKAIGECFGWDVGAVWIRDRNAQCLRCVEIWHSPQVEIPAFQRETRRRTYSLGEGLPGSVWARQSLFWIADVTTQSDFPRQQIAAAEGLRGAIGFPIHSGVETVGVLEFYSREVRKPDHKLKTMMASIASQISQFVARRDAETRLRGQQEECRIGREIQHGLLPASMPLLPGFQISGRSIAINVGGDSFDVFCLPKASRECIGVVIADACGHGIGAALLAAQTHAYLRSLALTTSDVARLLQLTNQCLCENPNRQFVTALLMILDPETRTLKFAGAGHLPGYVLNSQGDTKSLLPSVGLPLGMLPGTAYPSSRLSLDLGDFVLLITDGITEAMSPEGELYGMQRVLNFVRQNQQNGPDDILTALFADVGHFCKNTYQDDLTALIIKVGDAA